MSRRQTRHRWFNLVALVLTTILAIVAMAGLLRVGTKKVEQTVYKEPHLTLQALGKAQFRFFRKDADQNGKKDFAASLEELEAAHMITDRLAGGEVRGYRYEVVSAEGRTFALRATPLEDPAGELHYYTDQSQVVRARRGAPADAQSQVFWHPLQGGRLWTESPPPAPPASVAPTESAHPAPPTSSRPAGERAPRGAR